ncbi:DUF4434 domain-containing protein [Clostridium polynesiense]|uniref:DUF4434 domain-containing protein n=1 Tax=Clostridium polynesiense TaxID=1325933 RepID=UPI0009E23C91|nr:DUF4434 domain-containing protein [Clostridium polynesiense]
MVDKVRMIIMREKNKPIFYSSFIQNHFCRNWDNDRWIKELKMLKDVGINEVILQTVADTKEKFTVYPSGIDGYNHQGRDVVLILLKTAEYLDMKVRIGLGFNNEWWRVNALSKSWLIKEAEANKLLVQELSQRYGRFTALKGWYIPHEFYQIMALTKFQQKNLNLFFKDISSHIKEINSGDIMISPFFYEKLFLINSFRYWTNILKNVLNDSSIDILALQDSVGAGFVRLNKLKDLFQATKAAADELKVKLYADTETFEKSGKGFIPADIERIKKQMLIESQFVEKFVAFSINHYQNKHEDKGDQEYENYKIYYNEIIK